MICCAESNESEDETEIIRDICAVFRDRDVDKIRSADLVQELGGRDRRRYRNLTPKTLVRHLDPFEIRPQVIRLGNQTPRGYERYQFDDAMERYQISLDDAPTSPTRPNTTSATTTQRHGVEEFMTVLPVAEAVFQTTLRVIDAEARQQSEASSRPTDEEGRMPVPTRRPLH
jgi:hypothetical protein